MANTLMIYDGQKSIELAQYPPSAWTVLSGNNSTSELQEYFKAVPWLFRGTALRAGAVSSMPFVLKKGKRDFDTSAEWENKVGFMPNPRRLLWLIEACLTLEPAAYLFSDNVGDYRKRLRYILPDSATPVIDPDRGLVKFNRVVNGVTKSFEPGRDIVYFWPGDPYAEVGPGSSSPGIAALAAAGVLLNTQKFAAAFFKRGAIKATLFAADGMGPDESNRLEKWWNNFMTGITNAFRTKVFNSKAIAPIVIGEGLEALSDSNLTAEQRQDISTALGIPQTKLFSSDANGLGGGGVVDADDIRFYNEVVIPDCDTIAEVLNEQVFDPIGLHMEFQPDTLDIFQEDEAERAASMSQLVASLEKPEEFLIAAQILGYELPANVEAAITKLIQKREQMRQEMLANASQPGQPGQPAPAAQQEREQDRDEPQPTRSADLDKWRRKALKALKNGKSAAVGFESDEIPVSLHAAIEGALEGAATVEAVNSIFDDEWIGYP